MHNQLFQKIKHYRSFLAYFLTRRHSLFVLSKLLGILLLLFSLAKWSERMSKECKLASIMLVKESLANIMKHRSTEKVTVHFLDHPGFYKLTIEENGIKNKEKAPNEIGIGLVGMQKRME